VLYRNIRDLVTGQWVNVLFTIESDSFRVPAISHRASVADALGVNRTSLEVVDSNADLREGDLIRLPMPAQKPTRKSTLLEKAHLEWTDAELRELMQIVAKE